jgi:hypothetical protein
MRQRFEPVMDPSDLWTVWDSVSEEPSFFGDSFLIGLTRSEAMAACEILNKVDLRRQENKSEDAA